MKVLFLDIDGVLNCVYPALPRDCSQSELLECRYGFNPQLVERLRRILDRTGCKVVVSSSWRKHSSYAPFRPDENWRDVLAEMLGRTREGLFAGETGRDRLGMRGVEIAQWLSEHPVDSFCIVDDEVYDMEPYVDGARVVKTDMRYGVTDGDADRIVDILNNSSETE